MTHSSVSARSRIPAGHASVGTLSVVPQLIRALGGNVDDVLRPLNLTQKLLANPENSIPLNLFGALLHHGALGTGCEHFGLHVGKHSGTNELGLAGKLMLLSPTVGLALEALQKNLHLNNSHAVIILGRQDEAAFLGYAVLDGNFLGVQELQDGAMAVALNLMRALIGRRWRPTEVRLMRRAPRQPDDYSRFFGAPCHFNAAYSKLVFPAAMLDLPVAVTQTQASPEAIAALTAGVSGELGDDWIELVRRTTLTLLLAGNCSRQTVADALGTSSRTLNRKLEQAGSSFHELADYSRFTASRTLVKATDMPLREVAKALDYADPSSFCRAFKRWSGVSPTEWRKNAHA